MTRVVVQHAPGKLFIAGEYAVLEPGVPAILVAVDRRVTVTVTPADRGAVVVSDLDPHEARYSRDDLAEATGPVGSAIGVVVDLLAERGLPVPPMRVEIGSGLHEDGVKYGLGSSGAVTVATVSAVAEYCGVLLTPLDRYQLAMLATARLDPRASGGDLAASTWGGWIAYRAPDRAAVLDLAARVGVDKTLRAAWPGFAVRRLPPPRALTLAVGWTGQPVSTSKLVAKLDLAAHGDFVRASADCVAAAVDSLDRGDDAALLDRVRAARRLLADLDDAAGLGVFTPALTALCDTAEAEGGAAKPAGAGGGDCGIALLDPERSDPARLRARWAGAGVRALPLRVPETGGHPA